MMKTTWPQSIELKGWARWRRHVPVFAVTVGLNIFIFLTIPLLSQIREEPVDSRLAGQPTQITMSRAKQSSPQEEGKRQQPPEPELPQTLPQPDLRQQQPEFQPPSPPDIPELAVDMPELELESVQVPAPQQPKAETAPSPKVQAQPEPKPKPEVQSRPGPQKGSKAVPPPVGYSLSQVDKHPRLLRKVNPTYPYRAKRRGTEGRVVLKFLVDTKGRVSRTSVVRAEPQGVFEQSALQAVQQWRFRPGHKDGQPVPTWVQVPIRFELSSW